MGLVIALNKKICDFSPREFVLVEGKLASCDVEMMQFVVNITICGFSKKFLLSVSAATRGAADSPPAALPLKRSGISLDLFVL